jgi:hypothetical protein
VCSDSARSQSCVTDGKAPDKGERPSLEVVARVLRRLLFAACILLGLAFAVVYYAGMFGVVQFD